MRTHAIVRTPASTAADGLTSAELGPPDFPRLLAQHAAYVAVLRQLGLHVIELDPLPDFPDAYFVEDVAVIVPELAVLTNPGATARRGEVAHIAEAVAHFRPITHIAPPGTLEGGDVLVVDKHVMVGLSDRTNAEGARQLAHALNPFGYTTTTIPGGDGLHFKSSVNHIGDNTLLVTRAFAAHPALARYDTIVVDDAEAYAANTLLINDTLLMPSGFPRTQAQHARLNRPIITLDTSELRKMDGGLTCLSLRLS